MRVNTNLQFVKVICPCLHHYPTFWKMGCTVICPPIRVSHGMRQLVFNQVCADSKNFIEDRSGYSAEAMTTHFFLGNSHAPHGSKNCVVTHRSPIGSGAWKDKTTPTG